MNGTLSHQPLAELIREISSKDLSGTLRLEYDRAKTVIYFEQGQIVFAASNLRKLRLREYLLKGDLVREKDLAGLGAISSDLELALAVSKQGVLDRETVDNLLAVQVADVLRVALLWTDGMWDFNERARLGIPVRVKIDMTNLLREAAYRLPLKFVSLRFRNPKETITPAADGSAINNLLPVESFLLSRLEGPTKLDQLVSLSGLRELDAHRTIYGLTLSGVLKREYWQNAFRTEQPSETRVETNIGGPAASPTAEAERERSDWSAVDSEKELDSFFERLSKATNYYEVLDVPPRADLTEIKDTYYALARRYHPDRFHLKAGMPLHARISSAFARITQAYETLTNPNARASYDTSLERAKQFADSAPRSGKEGSFVGGANAGTFEMGSAEKEFQRAEDCFREGYAALQQGQINPAITQLAAACRLAPQEARYRAYYGRALAKNEKTRRLAEGELQAAIKLEPSNASYRLQAAEFYFDLKLYRRAQTELSRALALDPNNAGARALLRKLEKGSRAG